MIALGLPVPTFPGYTLDPPLRSRFQCRAVAAPLETRAHRADALAPAGQLAAASTLASNAAVATQVIAATLTQNPGTAEGPGIELQEIARQALARGESTTVGLVT